MSIRVLNDVCTRCKGKIVRCTIEERLRLGKKFICTNCGKTFNKLDVVKVLRFKLKKET